MSSISSHHVYSFTLHLDYYFSPVLAEKVYFAHTTSLTGGPPGRGGPAGGLDPSNPQIARLIRGKARDLY